MSIPTKTDNDASTAHAELEQVRILVYNFIRYTNEPEKTDQHDCLI